MEDLNCLNWLTYLFYGTSYSGDQTGLLHVSKEIVTKYKLPVVTKILVNRRFSCGYDVLETANSVTKNLWSAQLIFFIHLYSSTLPSCNAFPQRTKSEEPTDISYISVSKSTPLAVNDPQRQLTSTVWQTIHPWESWLTTYTHQTNFIPPTADADEKF